MPPEHEPFILIMGLRGAGKTTVGRALAARLGRRFLDLDVQTLALMGVDTVAKAWREHGEQAFRAAEARALREALDETPGVISLGGGTPTAPGGSEMIRAAQSAGEAVVVYLHARPGALAERVRRDPPDHRPALLGLDAGGAAAEMARVYAARDPLYRELADHIIDAEGDRRAVLDAIADVIGA